jgi:hypothetical protein
VLLTLVAVLVLAQTAETSEFASPQTSEQVLKAAGLPTDDAALLEFFRTRTLPDKDRDSIALLVHELGDDAFAVRERATDDLVKLGARAVPLLNQAKKHPDIEVVRRAEFCLRVIDKTAGPAVTTAAARLLAEHRPDGTAEVLLAFLPFVDDDSILEEVRSALAAVALENGKPRTALLDALHDQLPARRAVAAEAVLRASPQEPEAARALLKDSNPQVRLRVGLAFVEAKEKSAVPVLVALLAELPREESWPVEDLLYRMAGDQAPRDLVLGSDEASRKRCRDGWEEWWTRNSDSVDLAKLDVAQRLLGYTLLAEMDVKGVNGKVVELSPDKKIRWSIEGLRQPMDAQVLGENRVLVTEFQASQVTERNFKGEILWRKPFAGNSNPMSAQRLVNGNTFIACRNQLIEVDRSGKEVFTYNRGRFDIMSAQKLRNGQFAFITQEGMYIRLDAAGKEELKRFPIGQNTLFGSHFEALPNGHVLVPVYGNSRVVEFDQDGNCVWETGTNIPPTCLHRLPDGNTLVGSMITQQVVELNKNGKPVWDYRADGRLYQVRRR